MKGHLIKIYGDVFDIARRLKEIDPGYYPVYNKKRRRFEIYHEELLDGPACIPPFGELDSRTVAYVRETRRERAAAMIREMDGINRREELTKNRRLEDERLKKAGYLASHAERGGRDIPDYKDI